MGGWVDGWMAGQSQREGTVAAVGVLFKAEGERRRERKKEKTLAHVAKTGMLHADLKSIDRSIVQGMR